MNKARRNALKEVIERIVKVREEVEGIVDTIEDIRTEEEDAFENIPESLQDGDRGQAMQEAMDYLDGIDLDFDFDDAIESIQSAIEC